MILLKMKIFKINFLHDEKIFSHQIKFYALTGSVWMCSNVQVTIWRYVNHSIVPVLVERLVFRLLRISLETFTVSNTYFWISPSQKLVISIFGLCVRLQQIHIEIFNGRIDFKFVLK